MLARSLLLTAPRQLAWQAQDLPDPGPGEILVRTTSGAISSGSELPRYLGTARGEAPIYPAMTGYESVGVVLACGPDVDRIAPGDRVVASYDHRTHSLCRADRAIIVPQAISDAQALLAILSCDVAKGIRKLAPLPEEPVLVTGGGAIGLLTLFVLRAYGVRNVDVVEPLAERRTMALQLGARAALAPGELAESYPVGLECSSSNAAFAELQRALRQNGRLCVLADGNVEPLVLAPEFHRKELVVVGSSDGWDYRQHAAWYFDYLAAAPTDPALIFDYRTRASELIVLFARLGERAIRPVKVLVDYAGFDPS